VVKDNGLLGDGALGGATQNINTFAVNTWYHFALVRNGSTITAYVNGVADTFTLSVTLSNTTNNVLAVW
jgi:hypothetical protein